jgi:hypothetical protein
LAATRRGSCAGETRTGDGGCWTRQQRWHAMRTKLAAATFCVATECGVEFGRGEAVELVRAVGGRARGGAGGGSGGARGVAPLLLLSRPALDAVKKPAAAAPIDHQHRYTFKPGALLLSFKGGTFFCSEPSCAAAGFRFLICCLVNLLS